MFLSRALRAFVTLPAKPQEQSALRSANAVTVPRRSFHGMRPLAQLAQSRPSVNVGAGMKLFEVPPAIEPIWTTLRKQIKKAGAYTSLEVRRLARRATTLVWYCMSVHALFGNHEFEIRTN